MYFERLERTSPLKIEYSGALLDLYTFGIFHINMQDIVDKVALGLLSQAGLLEPTWRRANYLPNRLFFPTERIVKAEIRALQLGSLSEDVYFAISTVLADPHVVAIMQNLAANVIWAIGASGVRGIRGRQPDRPNDYRWYRRDVDPVEIGPNLRQVMIELAQNNDGRKSELRFSTSSPNRGETEVVIIINGESE